MASKEQTSIGGSTELTAGGTAEFRHKVSSTRWVSLVTIEDDGADHNTTRASVYVEPQNGTLIPIQTVANDGPDTPLTGAYPIRVSGTVTRLFCLIRLDPEDEIVFKFENQDGAASHIVHFDAAAASTVEVALENRRGA